MMPAISGLPRLFCRPSARFGRVIYSNLPPLNFLTIHYSYFFATCLLSAIIFWGSSSPARSVSFTDSLFLTVSAMTLAGLNTINLSTLNTFQQVLLFLLIMLGSAIFVSAFVVQVRKRAFERKFKVVDQEQRPKRGRSRSSSWHSFPYTKSEPATSNKPGSTALRPFSDANDLTNLGSLEMQSMAISPDAGNDVIHMRDLGNVLRTPSPCDGDGTIETSDTHASSASPRHARNQSKQGSRITFSPDTAFRYSHDNQPVARKRKSSFLSMTGVGALPDAGLHPITSQTSAGENFGELERSPTKSTHQYFPSSGFVGRNSEFHGLTEVEREKLGGVEYRAIQWLSWLVPAYYVLFQLFGCIGLATYVARNRPESTLTNGLNPWWVGAFNAVSAFNNSGMSLLDANMVAFQTSYYMLLTMGLLILAGNTCYPIFLRLIIWTTLKLMPDNDTWREDRSTLRFLLDHPRRCYTNLFPSEHTWWLLIVVLTLNGIDWAGFEILNIGNKVLYDAVPANIRVIDGLFQAIAVRSGGFYVVSIPSLRISLQVLYVVMMYISVYPVVITMRSSNVYEERSLGIYSDDPGYEQYKPEEHEDRRTIWKGLDRLTRQFAVQDTKKSYFVREQMRAQLSHDLWWLVLAIFLIMIVEGGQFETNPAVFSVFNVIFETVSAYGCVGISVGLPNEAYSFCGSWHTLSKLILCAVMLRGRHRGLPVAIDKAVLLPGEKQGLAEEEDAMIRMERAASRGRAEGAV